MAMGSLGKMCRLSLKFINFDVNMLFNAVKMLHVYIV